MGKGILNRQRQFAPARTHKPYMLLSFWNAFLCTSLMARGVYYSFWVYIYRERERYLYVIYLSNNVHIYIYIYTNAILYRVNGENRKEGERKINVYNIT